MRRLLVANKEIKSLSSYSFPVSLSKQGDPPLLLLLSFPLLRKWGQRKLWRKREEKLTWGDEWMKKVKKGRGDILSARAKKERERKNIPNWISRKRVSSSALFSNGLGASFSFHVIFSSFFPCSAHGQEVEFPVDHGMNERANIRWKIALGELAKAVYVFSADTALFSFSLSLS